MVGSESTHLWRKLALANRQNPLPSVDLGNLTETVTQPLGRSAVAVIPLEPAI
jgi:hypothetical protein